MECPFDCFRSRFPFYKSSVTLLFVVPSSRDSRKSYVPSRPMSSHSVKNQPSQDDFTATPTVKKENIAPGKCGISISLRFRFRQGENKYKYQNLICKIISIYLSVFLKKYSKIFLTTSKTIFQNDLKYLRIFKKTIYSSIITVFNVF